MCSATGSVASSISSRMPPARFSNPLDRTRYVVASLCAKCARDSKRGTRTNGRVRVSVIREPLAPALRFETRPGARVPDGPPAPAVMISQTVSFEPLQNETACNEAALRFLQLSARLLLEYNVRSKSLERAIDRIARHVGVNLQTIVGYREVTLAIADGHCLHVRGPELRINVTVSAGHSPHHRRVVPGSHRRGRSHTDSGSSETPAAAAQTLGSRRSLRAGGVSHRLAAARGLGRDRRERPVFRREADRAPGACEACHSLRAAVRGGADWRGDWRAGDPSRIDSDAGLLPDRSGADARAGSSSHNRRVRHAG